MMFFFASLSIIEETFLNNFPVLSLVGCCFQLLDKSPGCFAWYLFFPPSLSPSFDLILFIADLWFAIFLILYFFECKVI